ncbi:MAG: hypothetical protein AAF546_00480 [Verrucomicrobiota bacterium]
MPLTSKIPLKKIPLRELKGSLSLGSQNSLKKVIQTKEVVYLIVLESANGDKKKIIPAGPSLDFRNPSDALGHTIGGMRAKSYVDLDEERQSSQKRHLDRMATKVPFPSSSVNSEMLQQKIEALQEENRLLHDRVASARKKIMTQNQLIETLSSSEKELKLMVNQLENGITNENNLFDTRSMDIDNAENELIQKMNEYMMKEAELEQREEDLFRRERILHEETLKQEIAAG